MGFIKTKEIEKQAPTEEFVFSAGQRPDFVICKSPDKLQRLLASLQEDTQVHYISDGDWSTHDLIMELLNDLKPADLFITTYAIREFAIRQLVMAMERKDLSSVNMILDYRAKVRTPEVFQLAEMTMNKIFITAIHAKVTVLRGKNRSVTIVGSSNLTSNPRIEAGVISMNTDVANFHIQWIEKVMQNAEIFS